MPSMFTAETLEVSLIYTETFLVILLCSVKVTSMGVIREIIGMIGLELDIFRRY